MEVLHHLNWRRRLSNGVTKNILHPGGDDPTDPEYTTSVGRGFHTGTPGARTSGSMLVDSGVYACHWVLCVICLARGLRRKDAATYDARSVGVVHSSFDNSLVCLSPRI